MSFAILITLLLPPFLSLFVTQQTSQSQTEVERTQAKGAHANDALLESGQAKHIRSAPRNGELRIVSYNIRWRSGNDLKEIIKSFQEDTELGNPTIVALQEVDRQKARSGKTNTGKQLAEALGLYYAWAAPPSADPGDEEETGVAILSAYPLSDLRRIVLPHEGPGHRRRVALGATVEVAGVALRVYSAHAETRVSVSKKMEQLNALLDDLKMQPPGTPALIMGDLNTWQADAAPLTIRLFSDAGFTTPFGSAKTFSRRVLFVPIDFRLDWIWMRGLDAVSHGIDREMKVSDHWPLWTNVKFADVKK